MLEVALRAFLSVTCFFSESSSPMVLGPVSCPAEVYNNNNYFCHAKWQIFKVGRGEPPSYPTSGSSLPDLRAFLPEIPDGPIFCYLH